MNEDLGIVFEELPTLRPGVDWAREILYITIPIHRDVLKTVGKGKNTEQVIERLPETLCITSEEEGFIYEPEEVTDRGFSWPNVFTRQQDSRWPLADVRTYLQRLTEPVDPHALFRDIRDVFTEYIEYQHDVHYDLAALYIMGSYLFPLWEAMPYIHFNGTRASGKSQNLRIFESLGLNTVMAANVSEAALFRVIAGIPGLVCIDEAENFDSERGQSIKQILNAGYKKGGTVLRTERGKNDVFLPTTYHVYGPKVIASISTLEPVLRSRCIVISMLPATRKIPQLRTNDPRWPALRSRLYAWALQNAKPVADAAAAYDNNTDDIPEEIRNRDWELAAVFFTLATYLEDDALLRHITEYFQHHVLRNRKENEGERQMLLLKCLPRVFATQQPWEGGYYSYKQIHAVMTDYLDEDQVERFKASSIGRSLKPLLGGEVDTKKISKQGTCVRLDEEQVRAQFQRRNVEPFPEDEAWVRGDATHTTDLFQRRNGEKAEYDGLFGDEDLAEALA